MFIKKKNMLSVFLKHSFKISDFRVIFVYFSCFIKYRKKLTFPVPKFITVSVRYELLDRTLATKGLFRDSTSFNNPVTLDVVQRNYIRRPQETYEITRRIL